MLYFCHLVLLYCYFISICAEKRISMFDLLRHLSHYYWCVRVRTYVCACVHDFHCTQQSATQFACDFRLCSTIHSVDNLFHFFSLFLMYDWLYLRCVSFIRPLFCQQWFLFFHTKLLMLYFMDFDVKRLKNVQNEWTNDEQVTKLWP